MPARMPTTRHPQTPLDPPPEYHALQEEQPIAPALPDDRPVRTGPDGQGGPGDRRRADQQGRPRGRGDAGGQPRSAGLHEAGSPLSR